MQKALTLAHAFFFSVILHQLRRDKRLARNTRGGNGHCYGTPASALSGSGNDYPAWARIEPGQQEEVEEIRRGLAAYQATGTELLRPHLLGLLAEALHIAGRGNEALLVLDDALALADRNSERYYQAELYRLKGELLLVESTGRTLSKTAAVGQGVVERSQPVSTAEECFHQSMKIAQRQKARCLELRAATSLARHYQNQNRPEDARILLTRIYSTFTEGFDTTDMLEAKALLS